MGAAYAGPNMNNLPISREARPRGASIQDYEPAHFMPDSLGFTHLKVSCGLCGNAEGDGTGTHAQNARKDRHSNVGIRLIGRAQEKLTPGASVDILP